MQSNPFWKVQTLEAAVAKREQRTAQELSIYKPCFSVCVIHKPLNGSPFKWCTSNFLTFSTLVLVKTQAKIPTATRQDLTLSTIAAELDTHLHVVQLQACVSSLDTSFHVRQQILQETHKVVFVPHPLMPRTFFVPGNIAESLFARKIKIKCTFQNTATPSCPDRMLFDRS